MARAERSDAAYDTPINRLGRKRASDTEKQQYRLLLSYGQQRRSEKLHWMYMFFINRS